MHPTHLIEKKNDSIYPNHTTQVKSIPFPNNLINRKIKKLIFTCADASYQPDDLVPPKTLKKKEQEIRHFVH